MSIVQSLFNHALQLSRAHVCRETDVRQLVVTHNAKEAK